MAENAAGRGRFVIQSNSDTQRPLGDTLRRVQIDPDGVSCIYGYVFFFFDPADCMAPETTVSWCVHSRKSSALGGVHVISHCLRTTLCISQAADPLLFLHHHTHLWDLQRMLPQKKEERKGGKRKELHLQQVSSAPEGVFMAKVTDIHTQV